MTGGAVQNLGGLCERRASQSAVSVWVDGGHLGPSVHLERNNLLPHSDVSTVDTDLEKQ